VQSAPRAASVEDDGVSPLPRRRVLNGAGLSSKHGSVDVNGAGIKTTRQDEGEELELCGRLEPLLASSAA
jgi:hypothetical protein